MDRQRVEREKISPKVWPKGRKERGIAIKKTPYWVSSKEGTYQMARRFLFDDRKRADARQIAEAILLFCDRLPGKSGLHS